MISPLLPPLLLSLLLISAATTSAAVCAPGTYWHTLGMWDCASTCCPCTPNFFCPGEAAGEAEIPCPGGTISPPNATSADACTADPHATIGQIHIAYSGTPGTLSVDFVTTTGGDAYAFVSMDGGKHWDSRTVASSFFMPTIGYLRQATLHFPHIGAGDKAHYMVGTASANSSVFAVTPIVDHPEVFAVFGDFGIGNDVCMERLVEMAAQGLYDSVLHVGDFAYDLEMDNSTVGNAFMNAMQAYAATHPVMPAEGNHEQCPTCPAVENMPIDGANFTEYQARFWSVALNAGARVATHTNRYYSFDQGLVHFLVFSAEAYTYSSGEVFIANQLAFMKKDLAAVDRKVTPWVVALVHKAWWMETNAYADFNAVLQANGVDILFCGHAHYYERYLPFNNITGEIDKECVSDNGQTYTDPKYMVTIITGAAGNTETDDPPVSNEATFTSTQNYGFGLFTAHNATHATWAFDTVRAMGQGPSDYADHLLFVKSKR